MCLKVVDTRRIGVKFPTTAFNTTVFAAFIDALVIGGNRYSYHVLLLAAGNYPRF
jgi:hypothetical protein